MWIILIVVIIVIIAAIVSKSVQHVFLAEIVTCHGVFEIKTFPGYPFAKCARRMTLETRRKLQSRCT